MLIDKENIKNLFIKKEYDKVLTIIEENLLIDKKNTFLLNTKGMVHAVKKEYKDAVVCYEKCIAIDHTKYAVYSNLGFSYMALNDDERAIENFISSIKINDKDIKPLNSVVELLIKKNDLESAKIYLEKAIKLDRDNTNIVGLLVNVNINLGIIKFNKKIFGESEVSFRRAIELNTYSPEAHWNLGRALNKLGKLEEAISSYTHASFLDPNNPKYYISRGITPLLLERRPLISRSHLVKSINDGDWESSKTFLEQTFDETPRNIEKNLEEFIKLWSEFCLDLISQGDIKRLTPIFIKLFIMGERNKDLINLIKCLFENSNVNELSQFLGREDKALIKASYCQYNFLISEFLKADIIAVSNIQDASNLIKDSKMEDISWLIVRRSLGLISQKDLARKTLNEFIANLGN